jgi:hypothetical protein
MTLAHDTMITKYSSTDTLFCIYLMCMDSTNLFSTTIHSATLTKTVLN